MARKVKYDWSKEELARLYWDKRMSCRAIARMYGLSNTDVREAIKRFDIPQRSRAEAIGKGKDNIHWKDGRTYAGKGYIIIQKPEHPRANKQGYVREHILVWEESNKQSLPKGYVVHHLNGIITDNRPRNLIAMPKSGHSPALTMKEVQKRLREVEAELAQQMFAV